MRTETQLMIDFVSVELCKSGLPHPPERRVLYTTDSSLNVCYCLFLSFVFIG